MENILIISFCTILIILLSFVFKLNIKKIKKIGEDKELDNLVEKFPDNVEVCKSILKMLGNRSTKIKVTDNNEKISSFYFVLTDTILIANIKKTYTRIQTIAHECIHSVQDKTLLFFNYIFSNIYLIYFYTILILIILRKINNVNIYLFILSILSLVYCLVRNFLETDAMTKAKYLAKEYLEENNITDKANIDRLINKYDELNKMGIKSVNYILFAKCMIRIIISYISVMIVTIF